MLAATLLGADAELSQARPVERAIYNHLDETVVLPLNGPGQARRDGRTSLRTRYQLAANADDRGNVRGATTQNILAGALGGAAHKLRLEAEPEAEPGFALSAAMAGGERIGVLLPSLADAGALAAERDAISDARLLDTADVIFGAVSMYNPYDDADDDGRQRDRFRRAL
ncbi:MAG: hypothetical protein P8Y71_16690 [Pseudolabrys sp.]